MDTQLANYIILKNGLDMYLRPRTLNQAIKLVQMLEEDLNRLTQHSPYTIERI
jgi:hypothetical protein